MYVHQYVVLREIGHDVSISAMNRSFEKAEKLVITVRTWRWFIVEREGESRSPPG